MSSSDRVVKDHSCGGMTAYVGKWHEEVFGFWGIKWESSPDKSMRSISCGYELILCLCYGQEILMDTSMKWKQCGLRHDGTSMDMTLEARFLGVDSWKCHSFPLHFHYYVHYITSIAPPFHYYVTTFIPLSLSLGHIYVFPIFINSKSFKWICG